MGKIVLRLDRMMVDRKMSLNELAERVGISNVNLSKIKNNKVTAIRFSTLAAICEVLDCEAGDILEFQKEDCILYRKRWTCEKCCGMYLCCKRRCNAHDNT